MTTLASGQSVTLYLSGDGYVTLTTSPNTEGQVSVVPVSGIGSPMNSVGKMRFGPNEIVSRQYGPFGVAVALTITSSSGAVTYVAADATAQLIFDLNGAIAGVSNASERAPTVLGLPGTQSAYLDIADNVKSRFLQWQSRANAANLDFTPTHFFDPSATSSAGTGTYANPFTTAAQLTAWVSSLSGNLGGKRLGFKRGTTTREAIVLTGIYGSATTPFVLCPYGSSQNLPQIVLGNTVTTWASISASPSSGLIYKVASTVNQEIYQNGARVPKVSVALSEAALLTAMITAGSGCCGFATGFMYLYPAFNENPNLGQVEMTTGTTTGNNSPAALTVGLANLNGSRSGNVTTMGIVTRLTRSIGNAMNATLGGTNKPLNVHQMYCASGQTGVDTTVTGEMGASSAFSRYGATDALRLTGSSVTNCFAFYALNNSFETTCEDNGLWENNEAYQIQGNAVVEWYGSNSNNVCRYNRGQGYSFATLQNGFFSSCAMWLSGLYDSGSAVMVYDTTGAKNVGNEFYMNFCKNLSLGGFRVDGGTGTKCQHNTILNRIDGYMQGLTGGLLRMISANASTTIDVSRNALILPEASQTEYGTGVTMTTLNGSGSNPTGDYNAYIGDGSFRARSGTSYFSMQAWRAALVADGGSTFDANSQYTNLIDSGFTAPFQTSWGINMATGEPLTTNKTGSTTATLRGQGGAGLGYIRDINGAPMPLTAPTIGCFA